MSDGGEALVYRHFASYDVNAIVSVASALLLGILTLLVGFQSLNQYLGLIQLDPVTFSMTRAVFAGFVLVFSMIAFSRRTITEGILLMLVGLSSLIFSISELSFGIAGFGLVQLFFIASYMTAGIVFLSRAQWMTAAASLTMSSTIVISVFLDGNAYDVVFGIGMMVSGALFMAKGLKNLIFVGLDRNLSEKPHMTGTDMPVEYAQILVSTAGILSFATLSLVLGYYVLDSTGQSLSLYIVKMIMSVIVMIFGVYALSKGILSEGLMMFIVAMSTFIFAITSILHIEGPMILDLVMSFVFLIIAAEFIIKRAPLMTITSILLFLLFFLEPFESLSEILEVITMAVKLISGYAAIAAWVLFDTGRNIVPRSLRRQARWQL